MQAPLAHIPKLRMRVRFSVVRSNTESPGHAHIPQPGLKSNLDVSQPLEWTLSRRFFAQRNFALGLRLMLSDPAQLGEYW
jgi:hypothetical protein